MKNSKTILIALAAYFLVASELNGQKGSAPNGYYPANYSGDTFTGNLQPLAKDSPQFTLVYTKGSKSDQFTGQLQSKCKLKGKDGSTKQFGMEAFSEGALITVFYMTAKNKTTHVKENIVFAFSFAENKDGQRLPDDKRIVVMCTDAASFPFKAFSVDAGPTH